MTSFALFFFSPKRGKEWRQDIQFQLLALLLLPLQPLDKSFCLSVPQFLHLLNTGFLFWDNIAQKVLHKHRLVSLFLMHFKEKFSSSLSKITWDFSSNWVKLFFDTMLPQQLTQNHIKTELMSCSLASKHTPPGRSNCCHCNLILACWLQISVPLVVRCKNFDSHFTFQVVAFLVQLLKKDALASIVQKDLLWHAYVLHTQYNRKKQSKGWLFFLAFFYVKMHIKLFLNGEGNRGQSEIPRGTLLFTMLIFCTQKMLILQGWQTPARTGWAFPPPPGFSTLQDKVHRDSRILKRCSTTHNAKQNIILSNVSF